MAGWVAEHRRARMICPPGPCVKCSASKAEVHHKNEDWKDNRPENLERLCRSCHMKEHRTRKPPRDLRGAAEGSRLLQQASDSPEANGRPNGEP